MNRHYQNKEQRYSDDPTESGKAIARHIMELYPIAGAGQIKRLIGGTYGTRLGGHMRASQRNGLML